MHSSRREAIAVFCDRYGSPKCTAKGDPSVVCIRRISCTKDVIYPNEQLTCILSQGRLRQSSLANQDPQQKLPSFQDLNGRSKNVMKSYATYTRDT